MSDNLQELDGVGPARKENLIELGYDTFEALSNADPEELEENINRLSGDTALEIVVQSQNIVELNEAEVVESEDSEESEAEDSEEDGSEESEEDKAEESEESEPEEKGKPETVPLSVEFDNSAEYNVFFSAVYQHRNELLRTNRDGRVSVYNDILDELRQTSDDSISVQIGPDQLNNLHNAVRSMSVDLKGDNLISEMEACDVVESKINRVREEHLF